MRKQYLSAPLPFQGQKRMFAKEYIKVLQQFPDGTTFVDLFGGSGLLSHIAKCQKPDSTVIYNDFDGYRLRLDHIPQTNELLTELRKIVDVPRHKPILGEVRERVLSCIRRHDYKKVFERYKDVPDVVFLVDPPYLSTDSKTYRMYWKLSDYLDVLTVLSGHRFIYFTSNKSSIVELCEWIGKNKLIGNPFENCHRREFNAHMNYNASYTDIMLYTDVA